MKMAAILVAALAVASCDRETQPGTAIAFAPTPVNPAQASAQFFPQALPFSLFATACGSRSFFTPAFDLVLVQPQSLNVFMDNVAFRLIDGTGLGGPSITFPSAQLNSMFGSTVIVGSRSFPFRPQFGCGGIRPESIVADVMLTDAVGGIRHVSVSAPFR